MIGIDTYPVAAKQTRLRGAVNDAADFADWALDPEGGGVAEADLRFWTSEPPAEPSARLTAFLDREDRPWPQEGLPTKMPIVMEALEIGRAAQQEQEGGRVYLFFAGHGCMHVSTSGRVTCFVPGDYLDGAASGGLLPCDDLVELLALAGAAEVILILDCCRNETPRRVTRPALGLDGFIEQPRGDFRYAICRASLAGDAAFETAIDSTVRGAFSVSFVDGLRTWRPHGRLTMRDLLSYVTARVGPLVGDEAQRPDFQSSPETDRFELFARPGGAVPGAGAPLEGPPVRIEFEVAPTAEFFLLGHDLERLHRFQPPQPPADQALPIRARYDLHLPQGMYSLEYGDNTQITSFPHTGPELTHVRI